MAEDDDAGKKSSLRQGQKKTFILLGILLGLTLFYLLRYISLNHSFEDSYTIGQDTRWRDLLLKDKARNFTAFNNELLTSIAKEEHFQIRIIPTSNLLADLEDGKVQGILTTLQPNYPNQHLLFSNSYFHTGPVLIVSTQPRKQKAQGEGKSIIGIPEHSPLLSSLEQDPSVQIKFYDDIIPALTDLREGRIDGAIFPAISAYIFTESYYHQELKIATLPLTDEGIRLATLKNDKGKSLIDKFNAGLKSLHENGSYHDMLLRWGLIDTEYVKDE